MAAGAGVVALVGVGYRWHDLSRWGFWNDEAWVAISTRVEGLSQFLLSMATTPVLWGALLRPLALLPHAELSLRLLPFAWSVLTLWLAWRLGTRLAGHALGGLFAVALVALDPASIQWAKQLKQYSAEAALILATLLAADASIRDRRGLRWLGLLLAVGATVSNAQILAAPPVLAIVLIATLVRRDGLPARRVALLTLVVGLFDVAWYALVLRPGMPASLHDYYAEGYLPTGSVAVTAAAARAAFDRLLVPGLGAYGVWVAAAAVVGLVGDPRTRSVALVVGLLVLEIVALSALQVVPLGIVRTSLFLITALLVLTGAAAARATMALWTRPLLRPVAVVGLVALGIVVGRDRPWAAMASVERPEDVGPLIQELEAARMPDDRVLLYARTAFVWGYYQAKIPVLDRNELVTVGFVPRLDDPAVIVIDGANFPAGIDRAVAGAPRVWFVGSRFAGTDETRIGYAIAAKTYIDHTERRERALLLRARPR
ncbi:MAG TPA: glycosyltransferase family 39 protein [Candidatus Binatia bacterium]|jgi:hypothetical protein|nr:glycosyltransferase family 39 protein [Candidatus Binatia bacterium]